jgi:hypothetical protein
VLCWHGVAVGCAAVLGGRLCLPQPCIRACKTQHYCQQGGVSGLNQGPCGTGLARIGLLGLVSATKFLLGPIYS